MKALFVSNDPDLFHEESPVRARMQAYAEAIGELHIISRRARPGTIASGPLMLHAVAVPKIFITSWLPGHIRRLIKEYGIEVVSAQDPFEYGIAALKGVQGTDAKLHIQIHTDLFSPWFTESARFSRMAMLNRMRQQLADKVLPQAQGIRVVSERIKDSLIVRYGDRIPEPVVIPIAPPGNPPPAVPFPSNPYTFTLFAVSRLEPEKRIEDLCRALVYIKERYPRLGLMIAGEGRERARLERLVDSLGLSAHVVFLGHRDDAWGLMRSANVFVQVSSYEGYGRTLVEAALARVPIITTDVGIVGEVLKPFEDVLAVPPGDANALAFAVVRLVESAEDRHQLAAHAEATIKAHLATLQAAPAAIVADLAKTLV